MMPLTDLWQSHSGYWQPLFIRENLLPLGHAAWAGYTTQGRGLVVCDVVGNCATLDWRRDAVCYSLRFVPLVNAPAYLRLQGLPSDRIERLITAVQTYSPERDLLLVLSSGGQPEVSWLQNLAIAPPACYCQVCARWEEFNVVPGVYSSESIHCD
ncbi:hypothetical protein [Pseudanabaena sp. FACHB-2040]|uniref:hypothetical protein n=1 Tax=Pseudanabaena sp. FACHB-2040 TaxID=2692859 RepID=UPI001682D308|nr:hypothetical protein [Pseudanabaena sp. FACHB-2040]MBD2261322.1 hypothetical protein [Pseudanabaena sp. FACHB-2040]